MLQIKEVSAKYSFRATSYPGKFFAFRHSCVKRKNTLGTKLSFRAEYTFGNIFVFHISWPRGMRKGLAPSHFEVKAVKSGEFILSGFISYLF